MIRSTIKFVPHPEPQRLIDLWSQIVLKELLRREQEDWNCEKGAKSS